MQRSYWPVLLGLAVSVPMCAQALDLRFDKVTIEETSSPNSLWDGALEPGESARLVLWLLNWDSVPASAVTATLSALSPGVTVLQPAASCGDLSPDQLAPCSSPAFEIQLPSDTPCGAVLDFEASLSVAGNPGPLLPFSLRVGLSRPVVLAPPVQITDYYARQYARDIAVAGDEWGVLWDDPRRSSMEVYAEVRAANGSPIEGEKRVTPEPGVSRDSRFAWSGQGYGVVWLDWRRGLRDTYFAYLDARGNVQLEKVLHLSPGTSGGDRPPDIAWDGDAFGIAGAFETDTEGTIWFERVAADGTEATPQKVLRTVPWAGGGTLVWIQSLVWTGDEYALFAGTDPSGRGSDQTREVYFLDRSGNPTRPPTIYSCRPDAEEAGGYKCVGFMSGIAWNGHGFGTARESQDERIRTAVYFQRLDALARPDGPPTRVTEPEITTPWHQGSDFEEWNATLAWDGFGWGFMTGRDVVSHSDTDCDGPGDPDCECWYEYRPCDAGQQMFGWVSEQGRRLVPEVPVNRPGLAEGGGYIAFGPSGLGAAYTDPWDLHCAGDPSNCGEITFVQLGSEPWCPGAPPGEVGGAPPGPARLRVRRAPNYGVKLLWQDLALPDVTYNVYRGSGLNDGSGFSADAIFFNHTPLRYWQDGGFRPACHIPGDAEPDGLLSFTMSYAICNPSWPAWPDCPHTLTYYLVSASNANGEGPVGFDSEGKERAPERKVCLADP